MIGWAVETIAAATLLMLLVLMLRGPVARRFGPQAAYALWALPALRMILPPIPDAWRPVDIAPIGAATEPGFIMLGVPVAEVPALPQGWGMADVPLAIIALWFLGAVAFVTWHVVQHRRFCAKVLASGRAKGVANGHVKMIETRHAAGPLAFGVVHRYVAMPVDFRERYDEREQALALAHELGHHARGDLLANWVALVVLGCHWFNPVAWRAFRAFRADQEMACDAMVLARATPGVRHAYATAIVKSAHGQGLSAACHLHGVHELKGRLVMLSKHRVMSPATKRIAGGATLALAVLGLGITASGTQAAETLRGKMEDATGVEIAAVEEKAAAVLAPVAAIVPAQAAPAQPALPAGPAGPVAVPPVSPVRDGQVRKIVIRQIGEDDKVLSESLTEIPEIANANCGIGGTPGGNRETTITRTENGRTKIIVCKDRVRQIATFAARDAAFAERSAAFAERQAEAASRRAATAGIRAEVQGADAERQAAVAAASGLRAAMAGLKAALVSIDADLSLSAEQRREAVAGIREGMTELQAEMDDKD
ncbi:hypothetical protein ASE73_16985 [Sphingomonas sp. Leaf24]|uniref:M56 family metallopeptidase n=1 Tax=unclassified Sphingomonas TaxID=196159 RepID=UPI0006FE3E3D|nr:MULTISPECIES: M56 family metallopeptidase [unclassified Sphingomonas]KQM20475.1 hypothetical protein ASE50_16200 [Sphingomonas sp. Leaf5]KQM92316.1 hypothetical protein ASE73_16985 [Sphingomonas sp. Leaf24]